MRAKPQMQAIEMVYTLPISKNTAISFEIVPTGCIHTAMII